MQAEPTAQRALLDIAQIDTKTAQLVHQKRSLPEHEQLAELNVQRIAAGELVVASQTRLGDVNLELERIESDLGPARERLVRNEKRSNDGSVADQRALRALLDEIDHLKQRIEKLEDEQLEVMQTIEDETNEQARLSEAKTRIEEKMRELLASRDEKGRVLDENLADLASERKLLMAQVSDALLDLYTKISQRTGVGAAELKARRCLGCGLEIDATSLRTFASAQPDEVLRCEECGRILVRTNESGLGG